MFNHDIILTQSMVAGYMTFFVVSEKGRTALSLNENAPAVSGALPATVDIETNIAKRIMFPADLDVAFYGSDELSRDEVMLHARAIAMQNEQRAFVAEVTAYYSPLLDAAEATLDIEEMTRILHKMPSQIVGVEKTFVADRIRQLEKHIEAELSNVERI